MTIANLFMSGFVKIGRFYFTVTPMIIGVAVGVSVVVVATVVTALAFACFKHKKVHPSDTDTIYSDSISESDYESRPTTASHIFIDSVSKLTTT